MIVNSPRSKWSFQGTLAIGMSVVLLAGCENLPDARPSFGGVWVAYPGNTQPERVNIRNVGNGKSVVGALFKREADNPGPKTD